MSHETLLWHLLGMIVLPLWLLAGLTDYLTHARSDLAHTTGAYESRLHLVQTAEVGVPVLALLLFEVTALTLAVMALGVLAHTWTSYADLRYATGRRRISPLEQYAHSFLNVLPWAALAIVVVLHWPVAEILLGRRETTPGAWALQARSPGFPPHLTGGVLLASIAFGVLPGLVEYARARRARRRR